MTTLISRALRFSRGDEIVAVFCGSKKSLASGLPMATVMFAGQSSALIVLPLMLFHQIQLMACAAMARRYAGRSEVSALPGPGWRSRHADPPAPTRAPTASKTIRRRLP